MKGCEQGPAPHNALPHPPTFPKPYSGFPFPEQILCPLTLSKQPGGEIDTVKRPLLLTISLEVPGSLGEPGSALCLGMAAVSEGLASSSWRSKGSTLNLFSVHFLFERGRRKIPGRRGFFPAGLTPGDSFPV